MLTKINCISFKNEVGNNTAGHKLTMCARVLRKPPHSWWPTVWTLSLWPLGRPDAPTWRCSKKSLLPLFVLREIAHLCGMVLFSLLRLYLLWHMKSIRDP